MLELPVGVHALPEAAVTKGLELSLGGEASKRLPLESAVVTIQVVEHARPEDKEPAADHGL